MHIFGAILLIAFFIFYLKSGIESIHMLQLNSYRLERFFRWMKEDKKRLFGLKSLVLLLSLAFIFNIKVSFIIYAILCILILPGKKEAKTPLVYTARVKRIITTYIIIGLAFIVLAGLSGEWKAILLLTLIGLLIPYIVMLVVLINSPVEKAITRYYYNDAKKKIESMKDLIIIGVTGSYGKTSTKHVITSLLSEKYDVLMTPGNFNTTLGVVRTIREHLRPTHQVFVVEMGAKQTGDIKEICDLVKPKYGVISSIGPQHLETFKTIENVADTKFELARAVAQNGGTVFLNYSNEYIKNYNFDGNKVTYGTSDGCDVLCTIKEATSSGITVEVAGEEVKTKLLGDFNAMNIAAGFAVADFFGVDRVGMKMAIRKLEAPDHRLKLIKNPRYTIIDDAYNSNPAGSAAALKALSHFEERKILVTPGMVELGEKQFELNKEFGKKATKAADYIVLVGQKQAVPMLEGIREEGFLEERIYVAKDIKDALSYVYSITDVPSVVLLENDLPDNFL